MLLRTLAGIPRKESVNLTFKDRIQGERLRIDARPGAVNIRVPEPKSVDELFINNELPDSIPLRGDLSSQPYAPIEADKALVKFACSICPKSELDAMRSTIDWVRGHRQMRFATFPLGFEFTPGAETAGERATHVILIRRKGDGPEPYLRFPVQFRNFRFQVPVPLSTTEDGEAWSTTEHFQSLFPPSWPRGDTTFSWLNWCGAEKERTSWNV